MTLNKGLELLAGTVPFLSFVAEYLARKDVQRKLASSNPRVVR